ncbi:MAG: DUF502 domain-containing protein [Gammaproteobacteria bacterium]|nr:DUF502 domain-containing protein [Gammaproteobacteria bacterium]
MLRFIMRHILTGLMTILPVVLTLYLLYWFAVTAETLLGDLIRLVIPAAIYWPGMGLAAGVLAAFVIGLLMRAYLVQRLFAMGEQLIYHTPLIKSVYRALRDFLDYFSPNKPKEYEQVVAITFGDSGMQMLGFVTQNDYQRLPEDFRDDESVLVYIPMSYMIGGFAVLMPRSALRPVNMGMEEAMRFILTAGVTTSASSRPSEKNVQPEKDG